MYTVLRNVSFYDIINNENNEIIFKNFDYGNSIGILTVGVISLLVIAGIKIAEFFLVIYAAVKASNGEEYSYPLTIPFIK
ncbi:hypothetical protein D3C85_1524310 [compost metagenome]